MDERNAPATKGDLQDLEQRLDGRMQDLEQRLDGRMQDLEQRLDARFAGRMDASEQRMKDYVAETVRNCETRLLQAFYGYAEGTDRRFLQTEAANVVLQSRFASLEGRVLEIEKRLNFPPHAA